MFKRFKTGLIFCLLLLSGCQTMDPNAPTAGETVTISRQTEDAFKQYQGVVGTTHPGAFAVSKSGRGSYYYWCTDTICNSGVVFTKEAVKRCESYDSEPCYVFARGHDALYPYRVVN